MALTFENLKDYIVNELGVQNQDIAPDTLLFSTGLVDSYALVSLMMFTENEADIFIAPTDVNLENLDSIERILSYVARSQI